jgi:zinc protease
MKAMPLVVLLCTCVSLPRPGKPSMPDVNFRMRDFRLANGMRIIVEEDHASPLVGVFTNVGVGSAQDPVGREGLAHVLEHLAFRAKPTGSSRAWNQLEFAGVGALNAFTSFDNTMYFDLGSKDLLPKLLAIESARLLNPLAGIDQQTFDVEREVVRNELRQRGENEVGPALAFLQEAVFPPSHHSSRPVVGTHQSLSAITLDDLKKFVATHYQPANMTMLILGDVGVSATAAQQRALSCATAASGARAARAAAARQPVRRAGGHRSTAVASDVAGLPRHPGGVAGG